MRRTKKSSGWTRDRRGRRYRLSAAGDEYVYEDGHREPVPQRRESMSDERTASSSRQTQRAPSQSNPAPVPNRDDGRTAGGGAESSSLTPAMKSLALGGTQATGAARRASATVQPTQPGLRANSAPGGFRQIPTQDSTTGTRLLWQLGPEQLNLGGRPWSKKRIHSTKRRGAGDDDDDEDDEDGEDDTGKGLIEGYNRSTNPRRDYVLGRVIEILLVPPSGVSTASRAAETTRVQEDLTLQRRRFVIIRPSTSDRAQPGFTALPVKTHGPLGVGTSGVVKHHHSIIYSTKYPPLPHDAEKPQRMPNGYFERGMQPHAIRVEVAERGTRLDERSRLDYFDTHDFDDDVENVKLFGKVRNEGELFYQYQAVWQSVQNVTGVPLEAQGAAPESREARPNTAPSRGGAMGSAEYEQWFSRLWHQAHRRGLRPPRQPDSQEARRLASSAEYRAQYLEQLRTIWGAMLAQQGEQLEESSSEEDEEESEEED